MDRICTCDRFYSRFDAQQGLAAPKKGHPIFSLVTSFALDASSL